MDPLLGYCVVFFGQKLYSHNELSLTRSRNGNWWTINPLNPTSYQDRISPYYIYTISCIQVMRIKEIIGLLIDLILNSPKLNNKNCLVNSEENCKWDLGSLTVKEARQNDGGRGGHWRFSNLNYDSGQLYSRTCSLYWWFSY